MYYCKLKIYIFSKLDLWKRVLQDVLPLERFEHEFSCFSSITEESLNLCKDAHVIILDGVSVEIPADFRRYCTRKNSRVVLCQNRGRGGVLPVFNSLSDKLDELWLLPLSEDLIIFYFKKLLYQLKQQKDLQLVQNYLDTTIDSIPDLVWYKDVRGAHLKVNNSFCEAVGKSKEQCQDRGHYYIWDLKKEEYEKGEYVCLETEEIVLKEKKTCLFDENVKSKKGMRQFKTYKSPLFDEDGEIMGTVGIAHDVTDLENLGTELELILEDMSFAGVIVSKEGIVLNVNRRVTEYFKQDKEAILGMDYFEWKLKTLNLPEMTSAVSHFELELLLNGVISYFEVSEEPLYDVFQQLVGYFCVYRDITEHKKHLELLANYQRHLESDVLEKTKTLKAIQRRMIISFADIISSRDSITGEHIKRTSTFVDIIVNALRKEGHYEEIIDNSFMEHVSLAAPLHDIGKISIPDIILNKPGKFQPAEYEIMKGHAALGGEILGKTISGLEDEEYYWLARSMAIHHHERWDGSGYPTNLKGEQIPLSARIMAVADVFDALISSRPYKLPYTIDEACHIIQQGSGSQFDPVIVDTFLKYRSVIGEAVINLGIM